MRYRERVRVRVRVRERQGFGLGRVGVSSHLVQRQQRLHQELLVLLLEGKREAVDDGAEDLEQLGDT